MIWYENFIAFCLPYTLSELISLSRYKTWNLIFFLIRFNSKNQFVYHNTKVKNLKYKIPSQNPHRWRELPEAELCALGARQHSLPLLGNLQVRLLQSRKEKSIKLIGHAKARISAPARFLSCENYHQKACKNAWNKHISNFFFVSAHISNLNWHQIHKDRKKALGQKN